MTIELDFLSGQQWYCAEYNRHAHTLSNEQWVSAGSEEEAIVTYIDQHFSQKRGTSGRGDYAVRISAAEGLWLIGHCYIDTFDDLECSFEGFYAVLRERRGNDEQADTG